MMTGMPAAPPPATLGGIHRAWWVAAAGFIAIVGAAGSRAAPGVLIDPLHEEFGWSHGVIGFAVSINLILFGLFSPFAAALMDRFGIRRVLCVALILIAAGSSLTVFVTQPWHLWLLWGVVVGLGAGSMSVAFIAVLVSRWFVTQRGLVTGMLTAASATGQLVFLPVIAWLATQYGWRVPALIVASGALLVLPLVFVIIRDHPSDLGLDAYGATEADPTPPKPLGQGNAAVTAMRALRDAARTRAFWLLAAGFAVCGASTNGLVGTHFVPAAHDHGMPLTVAASLLAVIGIVDIIGTVGSGWLTDRMDPRILLVSTTRCAGCPCSCCRCSSARAWSHRCGRSSSSTAWTGWPQCRQRWPSARSTSVRRLRSCSAGCSPHTSSERPSRRPGPA